MRIIVAGPRKLERGRGCCIPGKLFYGVLRVLEGRIYWRTQAGCWRNAARTDPRRSWRRGNRSGANWKIARRRNVWDFFFRRKACPSERTRLAARHQLQAARLRRGDQRPDPRQGRGRSIRNVRRRAYGEERALPE